jgi:hypothetical protein
MMPAITKTRVPLGKLVRFSGGRMGGSMAVGCRSRPGQWLFARNYRLTETDFFRHGGLLFLQGFLQKCGGRSWFFDGEFVVERW